MSHGNDGIAAALGILHGRLRKVGYNADALRSLLRVTYPDDIGVLNHAPAVERLAHDDSALATAVRLLFLEGDVPSRAVAAVFSRGEMGALVDGGMLRRRAGRLAARLRLDPVGDQYLLADRRLRDWDRGAFGLGGRDRVYPPGSDSLMLRDAVSAPGGGRVLDLCTGSGIQALQRACTADRVVAVDLNPRAVAMTRMNAQLNGVGNAEVHRGDLYAPVHGEVFDLIIANPPFVASPYERGPAYHAGGPTGDRVLRRILTGFEKHLAPCGRGFAISHVALRPGEDVARRAAMWFQHFSGRALVLVLETGTAVDLAAAQAVFALERGLTAYAREVQRWVAYLRRHRILTVALLLIVAERGGRRGVEVVEAQPRVLPIPLSPPPPERIRAWLA